MTLKQFSRDIFFFILGLITMFFIVHSVSSPNINEQVPVEVKYEGRGE